MVNWQARKQYERNSMNVIPPQPVSWRTRYASHLRVI